jgi:hypothetical protein
MTSAGLPPAASVVIFRPNSANGTCSKRISTSGVALWKRSISSVWIVYIGSPLTVRKRNWTFAPDGAAGAAVAAPAAGFASAGFVVGGAACWQAASSDPIVVANPAAPIPRSTWRRDSLDPG